MTILTVYKHDAAGNPVWSYSGEVMSRGEGWVCLEARLNIEDRDAGFIVWRRGDRMIEWFYSDRWYNIFEVHDVRDDALKGWYCNITRPAQIEDNTIRADDLALDVFVGPDGTVTLLDEDEFAEQVLTDDERAQAWEAVDALRGLVERREGVFGKIG